MGCGRGAEKANPSMIAASKAPIKKIASAMAACDEIPANVANAVIVVKIAKARKATERFMIFVSRIFWETCGREVGSILVISSWLLGINQRKSLRLTNEPCE
jgi:hypothetical protein